MPKKPNIGYIMSNLLSMHSEVDSNILHESINILLNKFSTRCKIIHVEYLSEDKRRNVILRIKLESDLAKVPKSIILKQAAEEEAGKNDQDAFARFARDWAGLEFLSEFKDSISYAPKFYGASKKHRFILLEDLGDKHLSLVDSLMDNNLGEARASLFRYMTLMAKFHGYGHKNIQNYNQDLQRINPGAPVWQDDSEKMFDRITNVLTKLGIDSNIDLENEIKYVINLAKDPGPFTALIHGDICPDNVFDDPINNEMRLIDFEWSYTGNAFLDAVYLRMAMPTCWCVKAFPEDVIEEFDEVYRSELIKYIPEAKNDELYYEHYTAACAYNLFWRISHLEWLLEKELEGTNLDFGIHPKWKNEYNLQRPKQLYRLQAFIDVSKQYDILPNIRLMAELMLKNLNSKWKIIESVDLFPAFR
jgi:thiamine kinase-like enzyme